MGQQPMEREFDDESAEVRSTWLWDPDGRGNDLVMRNGMLFEKMSMERKVVFPMGARTYISSVSAYEPFRARVLIQAMAS